MYWGNVVPDVVVDVEKSEEVAVVESNDRTVENTTEESTTSPTQENNIATSNSIWDIPRYDQSHLPTREDLFATRGNFTGEKGTISITSTPLNNHVGDARDWMNDGSGDKISMVIHVLHDDFSHSESGKTYYYNIYNQTYQGSYEYPMTISKDGIY
jgi:hypothetical protein